MDNNEQFDRMFEEIIAWECDVSLQDDSPDHVCCSSCFSDFGLSIEVARRGETTDAVCQNCGRCSGGKVTKAALHDAVHSFIHWGSIQRTSFGAAPTLAFNTKQASNVSVPRWFNSDLSLLERLLGIGVFPYGPRLWMVGEVEPLKKMQVEQQRGAVLQRILNEYPAKELSPDNVFFRLRVKPTSPEDPAEYDAPPKEFSGRGRLDSPGQPVLYGSPDLQVCVHECRVSAEDETYVATLAPTRPLKLLDLSQVLRESESVTEFESLDMAVHMLFLASSHAYDITRSISLMAAAAGFDGIVYPSYFSLLRTGAMPFESAYGLSGRVIAQYEEHEQSKIVPNLALFGYPVADGTVDVKCINRLLMTRVQYDLKFGPAGVA
ncbi:RES family NAD+ phosphorylase [Cupriavidus sp. CV2]|uniref:RES family NAD+ phosphorylase n=1 Tax=Cupriavidus ulmosensis TaxID=3065913 RepID=UPI00296B3BBA|nr:RES family NAD+ phosphorylase [Cupriavidus sp. CV2]MDW3682947.1 RES family NAD+ phosphorylase [Cupriavidus sp. CV2]